MGITRRVGVIVAAGMVAASLGVAAPANADPTDDPCGIGGLAGALLCRMMPIAPGLDHDIDLTQGDGMMNGQSLPAMPGGASNSNDEMPVTPCHNGCS